MSCSEAKFLTSDSECESCHQTCSSCENSEEICLTCIGGTYQVEATESYDLVIHTEAITVPRVKCHACPSVCKVCSSPDKCTECLDGFFLSRTECIRCHTRCQTCQQEYDNCTTCYRGSYLNGLSCQTCQDNCLDCELDTEAKELKCLVTAPNWYIPNAAYNEVLANYEAIKFEPKLNKCGYLCANCQGTAENCLSCPEGSYIHAYSANNNTCNQCDTHCTICDKNTCQGCMSGYFLNNFQCIPCDNDCRTCTTEPNNCLTCEPGHFLLHSHCSRCDLGCLDCDTKSSNCYNCLDGYFLNPKTKKCELCHTKCKTCEHEKYSCLVCADGNYQSPLFQNCHPCGPTCKTCDETGHCESCHENYFFDPEHKNCFKCNQNC